MKIYLLNALDDDIIGTSDIIKLPSMVEKYLKGYKEEHIIRAKKKLDLLLAEEKSWDKGKGNSSYEPLLEGWGGLHLFIIYLE